MDCLCTGQLIRETVNRKIGLKQGKTGVNALWDQVAAEVAKRYDPDDRCKLDGKKARSKMTEMAKKRKVKKNVLGGGGFLQGRRCGARRGRMWREAVVVCGTFLSYTPCVIRRAVIEGWEGGGADRVGGREPCHGAHGCGCCGYGRPPMFFLTPGAGAA